MRILHTMIRVGNLQRSVAFYTEVLGMRVIRSQDYPEGIPLLSQEGEALFTLNGIQTLSGRVSNLLADYAQLAANGIDCLRLSPGAVGMVEVVRQYHNVRQGGLPPLLADGCNGYWHGRPGMLSAEEVGLC